MYWQVGPTEKSFAEGLLVMVGDPMVEVHPDPVYFAGPVGQVIEMGGMAME